MPDAHIKRTATTWKRLGPPATSGSALTENVLLADAATPIGGSRVLELMFAGTDAADEVGNWQVILENPVLDDQSHRFRVTDYPTVRSILAAGTFTLGAETGVDMTGLPEPDSRGQRPNPGDPLPAAYFLADTIAATTPASVASASTLDEYLNKLYRPSGDELIVVYSPGSDDVARVGIADLGNEFAVRVHVWPDSAASVQAYARWGV
jgi:hypothetical protein